MSDLSHVISIARRRIMLDRMLLAIGQALAIALPGAVALLLIDRLVGFGLPVVVYALLIGLAIVVAIGLTIARLPGVMEACIALDRRLQLQDRIGSAHALAQGGSAAAMSIFAPLVLADAQRIAASVDVKRATPVKLRGHWTVAGVAVVAFALTAWLVPMRAPVPDGTNVAAAPAGVVAARDAIREQTQAIRESLNQDEEAAPSAEDEESQLPGAGVDEKLAQLDQLAQQLAREDPTNPETAKARSEASASMNELADEFADRSARELESLEELAKRFEGLEPPGGREALDPQLQKFLDSMSEGDFETAAQALDEAKRQAESLDDEAKRAAAEQLRELSEQISPSPPDARPDVPPSGETSEQQTNEDELRRALEDLGMSPEDIDQMLDPRKETPQNDEQESQPPDQQQQRDTEQQLRESGVDEELAEKLARDIEQRRQQRETQQRTDEKAREVSESLKKTAEDIERGQSQQQQSEQQQQGEPPQREGEEQTSEERPQQDGQPQPSPDGQQQQQQPSGAQRETPQRDPSGAQQTPQPSPTPSQQQQQPQQSQGEQPGEPREQRTVEREQESPDGQPMPGSQQDERGQPRPGEAEQQQQPGAAPKDASSTLREMQKMRETAERSREQSEQLRERARELADTMSPEEKQALERWARAQEREQTPPPDDQLQPGGPRGDRNQPGMQAGEQPGNLPPGQQPSRFDADPTTADLNNNDTVDGRKIGELPGDDELIIDPDNRAATIRRDIEAQRAAQRAIEQGEVPARYHRFIQRYFRQFNPEKIHHGDTENTEGKK